MQQSKTLAKGVQLGVIASLALSCLTVQAQTTTLGLGMGIMPKYEGANTYTARFYPVINHQDGHFFVAPKAEMPALGLQSHLTSNWKVGVFVGYQWGRKASDDSRLKGTDKIDAHAAIGLFTQYNLGDLTLDAALYQAAKKDYGLGLQIGASYPIWEEGLSRIRVGGNLAFMNDDAMQTNFGVKSHEAAASGGQLSSYNPSGGLKSASIYGTYTYQLSQSLSVNTALGLKTLAGDARNSTLVESKTNVYGAVGLGYTF